MLYALKANYDHHGCKILVASFTYPPNKDGVSESAFSFAEGLSDRGHDVVVATGLPEQQRDALSERKSRVRVERFDIRGGPLLRDGVQGEIDRYVDFVQRGNFNAILAMCLDTWPVWLLIDTFRQIPARKVLLSHGFSAPRWHPQARPPWGLMALVRSLVFTARTFHCLQLFDSVVFLSNRRDFRRFLDHKIAGWVGHRGIAIMPNSVDPEFFASPTESFRKAHGIHQRHFFLCVANYSELKNQQLALQAFARAAISDSALVFIGSESNTHSCALQQAAARVNLAPGCCVRILSGVSRALTIAAFHEATAFVLSSRDETQPIVLLESMAAGLPFISTPAGCVRQMPGGIVAASATEMAEAMRWLAVDAGRRKALAAAGTAFAEKRCSRERSIEKMEQLLTARP